MTSSRFFHIASIVIVITIWILSLVPHRSLNQLAVPGGDKLHHGLAYFCCMFCWGQVYIRSLSRLRLAGSLVAMGALIECIQGLMPQRAFEWLDMAANTSGVVTAWLAVTVQSFAKRRLLKEHPQFHDHKYK